jgi:hypothetical protein
MRRDPEIERARQIARRLEELTHEIRRQDLELERHGISLTGSLPTVDVPAELELAFTRALEAESAAHVAPLRAPTPSIGWVRG